MKKKQSPHGLRIRTHVFVDDKAFVMLQFPPSLIAPPDAPRERLSNANAHADKKQIFWEISVTDQEFEAWVNKERYRVELYLEKQGIIKPNVGTWPAFDMVPSFAIWAIESQKTPGKIGWWVFSGDCPMDYVSEDGKCHPRNALRILLEKWVEYVPCMKSGKQPPNASIETPENLPSLAELLEKRITILTEWLNNDDLWENR